MMNVNAIALWVGMAGTGAAVYFPLQGKYEATRQEELRQAAARQKTLDEINDRFANLEMVVTVLSQETPKNTQMILEQIRRTRQEARPIVMYDKAVPAPEPKPANAVDIPKTEEPQ
jgi:hypothetical protein